MSTVIPTERPSGAGRALTVNVVSEMADSFKGHGVHTAFVQTRDGLRRAGVDVRVNSRKPSDILHIQTTGPKALVTLARNRSRCVVTAHIVPESLVGSFRFARTWLPLASGYLKLFYGMAAEVIAVSPAVADELHQMGIKAPIHVVPNAIDVAAFGPVPGLRETVRARLGLSADDFVAVCVGQVQPRKGIDPFLRAARALPDVKFIWVGGMPFRVLTADHHRMLREMADAPPNCRFVGEVLNEETRDYYAAADCLFFPSRHETFGLAVVEAAAAGLPLLLRDLPAYGALFGDSYIAADDDTFVEWLARLRDEPTLREHYSRAAIELAESFDTARLAEHLLLVYDDVLLRAREQDAERGRAGGSRRRIGPALQQAFSSRRNR